MSKKNTLSILVALLTTLVSFSALAGDGASANAFDMQSAAAIAAGLCMGLAALGGTLGQSRAAAAALEGIARNPGAAKSVQTPLILSLALIESLVLFAFAVAFLLQSQLGG